MVSNGERTERQPEIKGKETPRAETASRSSGLSFRKHPLAWKIMRIGLSTLWLLIWIGSGLGLQAASAKILKVLPHYLDEAGRHSLSPSLYERDAYQAFLREYPEKRSALRFDINWKAKRARGQTLVLRIELRSSGRDFTNPIVLERQVRPARLFSSWSSLLLEGEDYMTFGQLMAWRASLWRGDEMLAEKKSFLW